MASSWMYDENKTGTFTVYGPSDNLHMYPMVAHTTVNTEKEAIEYIKSEIQKIKNQKELTAWYGSRKRRRK